jgi:hypothetical protein
MINERPCLFNSYLELPISNWMKLVILVLVIGINTCQGQDSVKLLTSKKGIPILPQKGDWAIGLSTTPFFNYFGNLFNNSTNNYAPLLTSPDGMSLIGKFMKNATTAYRLSIALNHNSSDGKNLVHDVNSNDPFKNVTDTKNFNSTDILFRCGLEKRRGAGRLQGIYGLEALVGFNADNSKNTYGNQITVINPSVPFTVWNYGNAYPAYIANGSSRTLTSKSGNTIHLGVGGFIGVEYFIAPKISMGGELGYFISFSKTAKGTSTNENYDFTTNTVNKNTNDLYSSPDTFSFGTVPHGNINLILYF